MNVHKSTTKPGRNAISADNQYPQWGSVVRRRYEHVKYERFDNVVTRHASVGAASIGKVKVDCKFLFEKSLRGVLSKAKDPAGIMYFDLCFHQPPEHCLKTATVTVRLDEGYDGTPRRSQNHDRSDSTPVQFGSYGPTQLLGAARRAIKTRSVTVKPEFSIGQFGTIGGIGTESATQYERECRWTFSSKLRPDRNNKKNPFAYRILEWNLTENDLESQSTHSNTIHTAFSFQHDERPFLMHVSIRGELQSRIDNTRHELKNMFKPFNFGSNRSDNPSATIWVNFGKQHQLSRRLDELAESLDAIMKHENMRSLPFVIPDPHETLPQGVHKEEPMESTPHHPILGQGAADQPGIIGSTGPVLETKMNSTGLEPEGSSDEDSNQCRPTTKNLTGVLVTLMAISTLESHNMHPDTPRSNRDVRQARVKRYIGVPSNAPRSRQESSEASSTTLADEEAETTGMVVTPKQSTAEPFPQSLILSVMRLAGLIMQVCAIFTRSLGGDATPQLIATKRWAVQNGNSHIVAED